MTTKVKSSVLANTTVVAGTYGNSDAIPIITVDPQGRLTFATNQSIANAYANTSTAQAIYDLANNALSIAQSAYDTANTKYDKTGGLISGQIITTDQFMDGGEF